MSEWLFSKGDDVFCLFLGKAKTSCSSCLSRETILCFCFNGVNPVKKNKVFNSFTKKITNSFSTVVQ